jgi:hypothetical protein
MLPQFLSQMILNDQTMKFRDRMLEKERSYELEKAGYTTEAPVLMEEGTPAPAPGQEGGGPSFTANMPGAVQRPDLTVGGKGYYAPEVTVGKPIPVKGTGSSLVPIMRNGKIIEYKTFEGKKQTKLEELGIFQLGDFAYQDIGNGKIVPLGSVKSEKLTDDMREYGLAKEQGFTGTFIDFMKKAKGKEGPEQYAPDIQQYQNAETGEVINVDVRNPGQIELAKKAGFSPIGPEQRGYGTEIGKKNAIRESKINEESAIARSQVATLDAMDNLLDRINTGKLAKVQMNLQQYANSLGLPVDVKNLGAKEAFNALGEQMALQSRNLGEGMVLAGQMSDRDVQFLRDMNAQLVMSKAGNKMILGVRKAIARRQNEVSNLMREFKTKNKGRFDATSFDAYLSERFGKESIFGIPQGSKLIGNDSQTGLPAYETPDGRTIIPSF